MMSTLSLDAWLTLGALVWIFGMLLFTQVSADLVMMSALSVLMLTGVITAGQATPLQPAVLLVHHDHRHRAGDRQRITGRW